MIDKFQVMIDGMNTESELCVFQIHTLKGSSTIAPCISQNLDMFLPNYAQRYPKETGLACDNPDQRTLLHKEISFA